ncbi:MAG: DUF4249 domain-containing protein [Prevotellaceae bacterium]|nr:DUF4249 domain-containing protein [Prevotellaceae bacterium]
MAFVEYSQKIVVEGWIENGQPAQVLLSRSASFSHEMDTASLLQQVIKSAKVSVCDGERTEFLILGADYNYLPPYVYYGEELKGEPGKSYFLQIEYDGKILSAETHIPQPATLDSCWFEKTQPSDTLGSIYVRFQNVPDSYYQIATRVVPEETVFTPCLFANFPSARFGKDETVTMKLNKCPVLFPEQDFETAFKTDKQVQIKFRTQTKESCDFWTTWQNEILNAQNPVFPANSNLKSNIRGGIGVWCGYGTYKVTIQTR